MYKIFRSVDSDSCSSFSLLKAIAKSKGKLIAIALKRKSDNYPSCNSNYRKRKKGKKQRNYTKNEAKKIRSITLQGAIEKSLISIKCVLLPQLA